MTTPSPPDAGTAFIVFDNHRRSDMKPYVFRVDDYGRGWRSLATDDLSGYALSILQDHVDPGLLFLGTEFGLFVSSNGGADWIKFTAGLPTVSVMDMAIQQRESDLVLGTHGRSIFVLDDYSALRGLNEAAFRQRLAILNTSAGQQYDANQTPSTRFTGSDEFRAENEPYGVMVTFMASGEDLPHPDEDAERERSIRQRSANKSDEDKEKDGAPKVEMTIRDASGEVIRTKKFEVHQGVNRIVWGMERDGVRPMPGPVPAELEDGLPDGIEVPAGEYGVMLSLAPEDGEPATSNSRVTVLPDPRTSVSAQAREENYRAMLEIMDMQEVAVSAVERIFHAQADIATVQALIKKKQKPGADADENLKALSEQAGEVQKGLLELEKRFRTPPKTKGIVYDDDQVSSKIGMAMYYVGSTADVPSATAQVYVDLAGRALDDAVRALDDFMSGELEPFSRSLSGAGIGLFSGAIQP